MPTGLPTLNPPRSPLRRGCEMDDQCATCGHPFVDITSLTESYQRLVCSDPQCPTKQPSADSLVMGQGFGKKLTAIFGLEGQKVSAIRLDFDVNKPVKITVQRFATLGQTQALMQLLEEFECRLVAKPGSLRVEPVPVSGAAEAAELPRSSGR